MAAGWMDMFLHGFHPKDPKFYYYKIHGKRRSYYMIGEKGDKIVRKENIPIEILNQIPLYDSVLDYHAKKKKLDELVKKYENYTKKLEGLTNLKSFLEKDVERLIFDHGENLNKSWSGVNPQCYYKNPDFLSVCYSYRDYRTVEDLNRRRMLVSFLDTMVYKPIQRVGKDLLFSPELVQPFDSKWLIWSKKDQLEQLETETFHIQTFHERTRLEKEDQEKRVDLMRNKGVDTSQESYETKQNQSDNLKEEYERTKKEKFDSFFQRRYFWYVPPKPSPKTQKSPNKAEVARNILAGYGINTKKEWKEWLRKNHPDKGGNQDDCQKVITAGRELEY